MKKDRREFLKSAGKMAVWVPPALVVLTHTRDALGAQVWNSGKGNQDHPGQGNGGQGYKGGNGQNKN